MKPSGGGGRISEEGEIECIVPERHGGDWNERVKHGAERKRG